ncbi:MAG: FkbM family methyltransferase [Alphaproteobacteria bacterium]|nr:FkbM family methyltransferase [Alphaproteobacteria bacterium]
MTHKNFKPRLIPKLLAQESPKLDVFSLIDVGCSGGIDPLFTGAFGDRLKAVAFDPIVSEIERLKAQNTNPNISFEAAYVSSPNYKNLFTDEEKAKSKETGFFQRTSSALALDNDFSNYAASYYNLKGDIQYTETRIALDDYCDEHAITEVDFLKIDTDGGDYDVLLSAEKLLSKTVLGAAVEVNFHGLQHPHANIFYNIDRFMGEHGFTLWDIDMARYSRGSLPMPFLHNLPAETTGGAIVWGDAYYFRDLGNLDYEKTWNMSFTPKQILALACLYDLFGFPDCAVELMVKRPDAFKPKEGNEYLNEMVPPFFPGLQGYDEYIGLFKMHPEFWFPKSGFFGKR